jgi:hypothetical protein
MAEARSQAVVQEPAARAEAAQKAAGSRDTAGFAEAALGAGVAAPLGLAGLMDHADSASRTQLAMHLQRSIGNSALHGVLAQRQTPGSEAGARPPATGRVVQRDVMDWLSGKKKVRFRIGDWNLYNAEQGEQFGWSTEKGPRVSAPLALGVAPLPIPVGPVEFELNASASAYAGGNALIDVSVKDVVLEATVEQLMRAGVAVATFFALPGVIPLIPLALLASLKLDGEATLNAKANARVKAGANAALTGLANPLVWPVAGYGRGDLGAEGVIEAAADFTSNARVEFSLGRLRVVSLPPLSSATRLSARLALRGGVSAGMMIGYRPASIEYELWRRDFSAGAGVELKSGISGGDTATLSTDGDGTPEVDLQQIIVSGTAILQALYAATVGNDTTNPTPPSDPGVSAQGIGRVGKHGSKPPSLRNGPRVLWLESEHVIPFAVGKRLWEVVGMVVPGRGGHQDAGQTTIMIYYEAARAKTADDLTLIGLFEAAVGRARAEERLERARRLIDLGHPEMARSEVNDVLGLMMQGLRVAKDNAAARTNAAIATENSMVTEGSTLTNGQRRAPAGSTEPPLPEAGAVANAAETQFNDVVDLATADLEAANLLRQ